MTIDSLRQIFFVSKRYGRSGRVSRRVQWRRRWRSSIDARECGGVVLEGVIDGSDGFKGELPHADTLEVSIHFFGRFAFSQSVVSSRIV